jgi:hypothetical protein
MIPATCQHIKLDDGGRCGSPAMRGQDYCYFHAGAHRAIPSVNLAPSNRRDSGSRRTPSPKAAAQEEAAWKRCKLSGDALAIQRGLSRLAQEIMRGSLNVRQAKIILLALQRAFISLRDGTATGDSAVTSNQLQLPIPGGSRAATNRGPQQSPPLRLLG